VSFEAGDIISQVMSFGSPTPIEVALQGPNLADNRAFADKVRVELAKISNLRDLQYGQPFNYPTVQVTVDRNRAGQFNLSVADVAKSIVVATSSSRFVEPNFWRDPVSGNGFQIQVEIPQSKMASIEDISDLPVMARNSAGSGVARPLVSDLAMHAVLGRWSYSVRAPVIQNGALKYVLSADVSPDSIGALARQFTAAAPSLAIGGGVGGTGLRHPDVAARPRPYCLDCDARTRV